MADWAGDRRVEDDHAGQAIKSIRNTPKGVIDRPVDVGIICGSGLDGLCDILERPIRIRCRDIHGLEYLDDGSASTGLHSGRVGSKHVLIFGKRLHGYEGLSPWETALPVRILAGLGVGSVVSTCASGSLKRSLEPGSILLLRDHINLSFSNPGRGLHFGPTRRLVDMAEPYSEEMNRLARWTARENKIPLTEGVLASVSGPSYETRAEANWLRAMGADIVSMSVVSEVVVSRMFDVKVMGLSAVTNYVAFNRSKEKVTHEEVLAVAREVMGRMAVVIEGVIKGI